MSLIRSTYAFTHFSNNKILCKSSFLIFRCKSTTTNNSEHYKGQKDDFNKENNVDNENKKSPASINTIIKNSFIKDNDIPWTGEEDIKTTVLRMIVDKYPPLKIKRETIKEYIDAHSKVVNFTNKVHLEPPLQPPVPVPSNNIASNKKSIISKEEKLKKIREVNQSRIINAKDAATDYSIKKKLGTHNDVEESSRDKQPPKVLPKSIAGWNNLVENRIQEAIVAGEFENLRYHGKPLPTDPNDRNPYLDRTEFLMNRIVQRQGSAPAWIEVQKEVNNEISLFRQRMRESWLRYASANKIDPHSRNISWENDQKSYFEKTIKKLNSRLRSYNTVAPYVVRRGYLNLKLEFGRMYQNVKQDTNNKTKVMNKGENENKDINLFNDNDKLEFKKEDNIWESFAKSIKWILGR
ncbi:hypothetical protein RhiirC2_853956 [Rhizophagus irregularis]|uniref:DnaJ homologue subfamily C member 28 conserved domain-containing protein n=1 Tax=Rhizophagus irregularis TaxID=588596 RepID=A0A2N1MTG1_9GLOM|nr:hypothetical protein RhiirC2_853956 [Rhizophagus irregularis]